jgi:hydroxypyruvate isomerase
LDGSRGKKITTKKDTTKEVKLQAKANLLKELMQNKAAQVTTTAKTKIECLQVLEQKIQHFITQVNANPADALTELCHNMDINTLQAFMQKMAASGTGTAEGKLKQNGAMLFGTTMLQAMDFQESLEAAIETGSSAVNYAFVRACEQNDKYTMRGFQNMIQAVWNQKLGATNTSSSSGQGCNQDDDDLAKVMDQTSLGNQ